MIIVQGMRAVNFPASSLAEFYSRKILPGVGSTAGNHGGHIQSLVRESWTVELGKLRASDKKRLD